MVQVPRVITCLAIYQQSAIPPIQYPVSRLHKRHLLVLREYQGIPILSTTAALQRLEAG
jgi:hypothetical protein